MNFSAIFIRRPVATILLSIGLLISGAVAYRFLPVAPLPSVDIPTIVVFATRPGADPETMANSIAAPLERHLGEISAVSGENSPRARRPAATNAIIAALSVQSPGSARRSSMPPAAQASRKRSRSRELQLTPPLTVTSWRLH